MRRRGVQGVVAVAVLGASLAAGCAVPVLGRAAPTVGEPGEHTGQQTGQQGTGQQGTGQQGTGPTVRCDMSTGGPAPTAAPEQVQLDPDAVRDAVAYASWNLASTVRIYRHGCLVATSGNDAVAAEVPTNLWSATKGVVAILVGRAITMGALGLDDPIGAHLDGLDAAHAAITVRQLLTQTSGLRFAWLNEANPALWDSVRYTLGLPFDHEPGTYFEYAQTPVTVLGAVVEAAVGMDLQDFAAAELFEPLGISRDRWWWTRDVSGHTIGYAYLSMRPADLDRLGELLLRRGRWGDRQLVEADYVDQMSTSTPTNPGYGFLVWTNRGEWHHTPSALVRQRRNRRWLAAAPHDLYALAGLGDQLVDVIPSLDMVVVRTGLPGEEAWHHEFFRRLMRGVRDVHVPDPGPFSGDLPPVFDLAKGIDLATWPW